MKILRVIVEKQPDLYQELTTAMLTHTRYQGCYVQQYSETQEGGQTVVKFTLRESRGGKPE